ncbi:MAG: TIGR02281 family clan AA aspartic protease [Desulfobacterales bacterium]|jgi:aspartyl protease family protein
MTERPTSCPHCQAAIDASERAWSQLAAGNDRGPCPHCRQPLTAASADPVRTGWPFLAKFGIGLALIGGLMIGLNSIFDVLSLRANPGQILYELVFAGFVAAYLASGRTIAKIKGLLVWGLIFAVGMLGYVFRHDLASVKDRMLAALIPEFGSQPTDRTLKFHVSADGHFYIRAQVNGISIRFLVDTGASHIVLTPRDAQRLGLDRRRLTFDKIYATANGVVRGASIEVDDFRVRHLHLQNVRASVNEAPMGESLLGMTFFNRMQRYAVENDVLTIEWAAE